ncbi:hypothetical protein HDE_04436 [Halotydeus destructor]|nr:hypothetical protein HDE_04436 [Halotydeus destructor]
MTIDPTLLQSKLSKRQRDFIAAALNTIPIKEGKPFIKECWTTKVINQQKHEMVTLSYDNQTGTGYGLTKTKAREEARSDLMTKSGWTMETLELKYEKTFEEFHRVDPKKKPGVNKKPNARPTKNGKNNVALSLKILEKKLEKKFDKKLKIVQQKSNRLRQKDA